jgi:prephenate dehydratase
MPAWSVIAEDLVEASSFAKPDSGGVSLWEVVGGEDKGGIIAREGQELASPEAGRLATGALIQALEAVAHLGLNMSRIESRPSKRELGEYVFFVDVELPGQQKAESLERLTHRLKPLCEHLLHFGAYPSTVLE